MALNTVPAVFNTMEMKHTDDEMKHTRTIQTLLQFAHHGSGDGGEAVNRDHLDTYRPVVLEHQPRPIPVLLNPHAFGHRVQCLQVHDARDLDGQIAGRADLKRKEKITDIVKARPSLNPTNRVGGGQGTRNGATAAASVRPPKIPVLTTRTTRTAGARQTM